MAYRCLLCDYYTPHTKDDSANRAVKKTMRSTHQSRLVEHFRDHHHDSVEALLEHVHEHPRKRVGDLAVWRDSERLRASLR